MFAVGIGIHVQTFADDPTAPVGSDDLGVGVTVIVEVDSGDERRRGSRILVGDVAPRQLVAGEVGSRDGLVPESRPGVAVERIGHSVVVGVESGHVSDTVRVRVPHRVIAMSVAVEVEPDGIQGFGPRGPEREIGGAGPARRRTVAGPEEVLDRRVHEVLDAAGRRPVPRSGHTAGPGFADAPAG